MPIFQKSIVDKYVATIDVDAIDKAFESYKHIYSAQKIQRIKKLKEEQYQGGFLKDIFGSVLGYTIDPEVGYNLELEKKNETNSKKADGAILKDKKVLGVIELKSNTTKNLESIKDQAFGYKNNHKGCKYVISSNFHKLRFYVDDATEYEEFDLYNLDKETFKRFYLFLRKEGLLDKNIPKLLKEETKFHEENISKQLYKDYSAFKNKFFENIVKNNPQYDKLLLFKKSQKFLDRILFVLFAEDKELIPTNAISKIVESWVYADDLHYKPLYELFTILFEHLNVGHTYKSGYEIPAYNGGLFAPDDVLDNLKVDDEILKDDLLILSKYDFNTDVDVNILGHIFEHSLSEIEEIEAQLKGEEVDKSKGKRKKDGVFYTPKYITKYIVDNTVGKLCSEKKDALGLGIDFDIQEYQKSDGSVNQKGRKLFHTLESYKEWLLTLKILDPACGSGAFLNQALSFLIEEHKNIDDLIAELTNSPLRIFDTDKAILENNIFGVDINDESVEIAKLSLWLRTAQKGRKLSNLNNNIKCGNSLIDDPAVAGDKAFKWEDEFPEIFAKGGFDVIIGNPPYVPLEEIEVSQREFIKSRYPQLTRKYDLSAVFKIQCINILKKGGYLSFVTTITWQTGENYSELRRFIFKNTNLHEIVNLPFNVFPDAYVDTGVFILTKDKFDSTYRVKNFDKKNPITTLESRDYSIITNEMYNESDWKIVLNPIAQKILKRALSSENTLLLGEISESTQGLSPSRFQIQEEEDEALYPFLVKGQVYRYEFDVEQLGYTDMSDKPNLTKYYSNCPKILIRRLVNRQNRLTVGYNNEKCVFKKDINPFIVIRDDIDTKFLLGILASKLISYLYVNTSSIATKDDFRQTTLSELRRLPIIIPSKDSQNEVIKLVESLLQQNKEFRRLNRRFQNFLISSFHSDKIGKNLQSWSLLTFDVFIKELNKLRKFKAESSLSKQEELEWMDVFTVNKSKLMDLKSEMDRLEEKLDSIIFELYELDSSEKYSVMNS